eukprot:m.200700 g.200700  ORF g.200700 m.200700 type:complete len:339 (-) comp21145_c0_seq1:88-1104(-)
MVTQHICIALSLCALSASAGQGERQTADGTVQAVKARVQNASRLLWLHIPKTGGTTIATAAIAAATHRRGRIAYCYTDRGSSDCASVKPWTTQRGFKESSVPFFPDAADKNPPDTSADTAMSRRQPPQPTVVFGHYTLTDAQRWKDRQTLTGNTVTIAFMRHPLDRFFSGYRQNLRAKGTLSIDEFAVRCVNAGNRMMDVGPMLEYLGVDHEHDGKTAAQGEATGWAPRAQGRVADRTLVDNAINVIDQDDFVPLISEYWRESEQVLRLLGIVPSTWTGGAARNVSPRKGKPIDLPYASISKIRACTSVEEPVYHQALAKFARLYQGLTGRALGEDDM